MKTGFRTAGMLTATFLLLAPDIAFEPSESVPWLPLQVTGATADAQVGGVHRRTRRRTRRRTAVVVHSADEASAQQQQQQQAQQQQQQGQQQAAQQQPAEQQPQEQQAAQQQAAPQQQPATPAPAAGQAVPEGTVVQKLPDGCSTQAAGGVEYYNCGGTYYRAAFQENNLVYVSTAPPQ